MMEMLHVMCARRLQIDQHGHFTAELVEGVEIDCVRRAVGDRCEMNESIGRAADRLQHHLRIAERGWGQDLARPRALGFGHCGGRLCGWFNKGETPRNPPREWSPSSAALAQAPR